MNGENVNIDTQRQIWGIFNTFTKYLQVGPFLPIHSSLHTTMNG